jgi:AcrR family transcriptional regulator
MTRPASSAGARRSQAERRASSLDRITGATLEILAESGYGATTMEGVAERAGTSRGGILHYFPTKVDMVVAAMDRAREESIALVREAAETLPKGPARTEAALDFLYGRGRSEAFAATMAIQVGLGEQLEPPELRVAVRRLQDDFREVAPALFDVPRSAALNEAIHMLIAILRGLSVVHASDDRQSHWPYIRARMAEILKSP